jgi:hypothetical protein
MKMATVWASVSILSVFICLTSFPGDAQDLPGIHKLGIMTAGSANDEQGRLAVFATVFASLDTQREKTFPLNTGTRMGASIGCRNLARNPKSKIGNPNPNDSAARAGAGGQSDPLVRSWVRRGGGFIA